MSGEVHLSCCAHAREQSPRKRDDNIRMHSCHFCQRVSMKTLSTCYVCIAAVQDDSLGLEFLAYVGLLWFTQATRDEDSQRLIPSYSGCQPPEVCSIDQLRYAVGSDCIDPLCRLTIPTAGRCSARKQLDKRCGILASLRAVYLGLPALDSSNSGSALSLCVCSRLCTTCPLCVAMALWQTGYLLTIASLSTQGCNLFSHECVLVISLCGVVVAA